MEATETKSKDYISGKITGLPEHEYKANFEAAEMHLRAQGRETINPVTLCAELPTDSTWDDYMALCLRALLKCKRIYMLRNWGDSRGARVERAVAIELGLEIIYQS
jgi:hypothetical protein